MLRYANCLRFVCIHNSETDRFFNKKAIAFQHRKEIALGLFSIKSENSLVFILNIPFLCLIIYFSKLPYGVPSISDIDLC